MTRRLVRTLTLAAATTLAPLAAAPAPAQPADQVDDPRAKALEIMDRHVEAIGGKDAILAHKSITTEGKMSVPAAGLEGDITVYLKAPDLSLTRVTLPGFGESMTGHDGDVAWIIDPSIGASIMSDEMRDAYIRSSSIYADLDIENYFETIKYAGEDEINDTPVHAVLLVDEYGRETTRYYAKDTGLLTAVHTVEPSPFGEVAVRYGFSDYKDFGGVKFPVHTRQHVGPQTIHITLDDISYEPIPDETFELPDAIKILVNRQGQPRGDDGDDDDGGDDDGGGDDADE